MIIGGGWRSDFGILQDSRVLENPEVFAASHRLPAYGMTRRENSPRACVFIRCPLPGRGSRHTIPLSNMTDLQTATEVAVRLTRLHRCLETHEDFDRVLAALGRGEPAELSGVWGSACALADRYGVEMPITREVFRVLFEDKPALQAVTDLMTREPKPEHV